MLMPDLVKIYNLPGRKYHLHPICAGGNIEAQEIHEMDFLHLLREGEICRNCVSDPESFALIVERDIIKKIRIRIVKEYLQDGDTGVVLIGGKKYMVTMKFIIEKEIVYCQHQRGR